MLVVGIGGYMVWRAKQDVAEPVAEPVAVSPTPTEDLTPAPPEPASTPPHAVPASGPFPALAHHGGALLGGIATLTGRTRRRWGKSVSGRVGFGGGRGLKK